MSDEPGFFAGRRVAIIGLGLIGGSLALALRGRCLALMGCDQDDTTLALARQLDLADELTSRPEEVLPIADVVVLATPVRAILDLLADLPALHPGRALVLDLGSTKREILAAMASLPERFDPLGGHPMCGKERGGLEHAEAAMFQDAPFAFVPLKRTTSEARLLAESLAATIGAHPIWLDAETHDRWAGAISHLPYLLSAALAQVTPPEAAPLAGPGFRSATRLAATPAGMMLDVLLTNRNEVLVALERLRGELDELHTILSNSETGRLQAWMEAAARQHQQLLAPPC